jgi:hypothetical protein
MWDEITKELKRKSKIEEEGKRMKCLKNADDVADSQEAVIKKRWPPLTHLKSKFFTSVAKNPWIFLFLSYKFIFIINDELKDTFWKFFDLYIK